MVVRVTGVKVGRMGLSTFPQIREVVSFLQPTLYNLQVRVCVCVCVVSRCVCVCCCGVSLSMGLPYCTFGVASVDGAGESSGEAYGRLGCCSRAADCRQPRVQTWTQM